MENQLEAIVMSLTEEGYNVYGSTSPESIMLSFMAVNSYDMKNAILEKAKGYFFTNFGKGNVLEDFDEIAGNLDLYFRRN